MKKIVVGYFNGQFTFTEAGGQFEMNLMNYLTVKRPVGEAWPYSSAKFIPQISSARSK
ncbi:MAG: hypothetical protein MRJ67_16495 [Nitrospirales bacterium]|nr:hypothetical protein [Nitrospira sp.]MDR4462091.1 hypothetical protein [Nitrospirales bacterium]MDR4482287.1 hypothetical protein [Nitrospirales bacterium]